MRNLITCMGELLIDFLPIEAGQRTTSFSARPAGAPVNVAVGLARLGQPTAFAGKVSTDVFGRSLRDYADVEGIDTRFLLNDEAPSTLAFVTLEAGEPVFTFYGEQTADTLLTVDEIPEEFFAETRVLHFGSISLLRGTTPAAVLAAVERLKGHALLSFDPNIRPGLIRDEPTYRALLDRIFTLADIVKLSAADIEWLAPGQPVDEVAAELLMSGPALVVVTRGGQGVLATRAATRAAAEALAPGRTRGGLLYSSLPAFQVQVVDTIGAGDAFSAGLLAALAEREATSHSALTNLLDEDLNAVLRFAVATSALTCGRAGANPPQRAEVERFLNDQK